MLLETSLKRINNLLSTVYSDIMKVEERELRKSEFKDISLRALHAIDAIIIRLGLTSRGRLIYRAHDSFHRHMVKKFIAGFDNEQVAIIERALLNLRAFLEFPARIDNKRSVN